MKKLLLLLFLSANSGIVFCQTNDNDCKNIVSKKNIQRKFGEWLRKRQDFSDVITSFSKINLTEENKSQIQTFSAVYNSNVTLLNGVIDSVIEKLKTNEVKYVVQGTSLTNEYKDKFSPPLKSLDSLRQVAVVYYNSIAPEGKKIRSFGGISTLIEIIEILLPKVIEEIIVPAQIRKMECLRWKKWEI